MPRTVRTTVLSRVRSIPSTASVHFDTSAGSDAEVYFPCYLSCSICNKYLVIWTSKCLIEGDLIAIILGIESHVLWKLRESNNVPVNAIGRSRTPAGRLVARIARSAARHGIKGFWGCRSRMPTAGCTIAFHITTFTCVHHERIKTVFSLIYHNWNMYISLCCSLSLCCKIHKNY